MAKNLNCIHSTWSLPCVFLFCFLSETLKMVTETPTQLSALVFCHHQITNFNHSITICCNTVQVQDLECVQKNQKRLREGYSIGDLFPGKVGLSFKSLFVFSSSCRPTPPIFASLTFLSQGLSQIPMAATLQRFLDMFELYSTHYWFVIDKAHGTCDILYMHSYKGCHICKASKTHSDIFK